MSLRADAIPSRTDVIADRVYEELRRVGCDDPNLRSINVVVKLTPTGIRSVIVSRETEVR